MRFWIITAAALLALSGAAIADADERKTGVEALYMEHCASCHGDDLAGGSGSSLIDGIWTHGGSDDDIARIIMEGAKDMGMPAWKGALDARQVRSLVIYLREREAAHAAEPANSAEEEGNGVFNADGVTFAAEELGRGESMLWSIDFMPDGSMLATQRDGVLWHFRDDERVAIKGLPDVWQHGQGGLLEVQLHPAFAENGWVYLSYSEHTGARENDKEAGMTTVVRGRIRDGKWIDQEKIFAVDEALHNSSGAHFGSRFVFRDGFLFFSIGDRGRQAQAQDLGRPNGKIFRIHDDGRIPADNPFVDTPGALPAIWSYGHRNAQGLDIDPATGLLWETEHGPRGGDEVNLIEKGKNYGWPVITYGMNYNGTPITHETRREGMEQPKHYWVPSIAVAGIDFYQGDLFPAWKGKLLAGGMASEELHLLTIDAGQVTADRVILRGQGRIRDVASGPDGAIYLVVNDGSPRTGRILRLAPAPR